MSNKTYFRNLQTLLLLGSLLLAGCSTMFVPGLSQKDAASTAAQYTKLAETSSNPLATEYRLRAADLYVQNQQISEAQKVLRIAQLNPQLDESIRKSILEARLALLKKDYTKFKKIIKELLARYSYDAKVSPEPLVGEKRIALILPTKGPHAEAAKTIRNGFLAAYYRAAQAQQTNGTTVKIYDTGEGNLIREAYQKAISDQANFIIGPLTKPELQIIANMQLDYPVLALNTLSEDSRLPAKLYQFGLMPEDEVLAAASLALKQGLRNALVLAPQTEWGQRLANTFKSYWESHHGKVIDIRLYKGKLEVESKIRALLQVKNKERRKDADMIFLVASPDEARQIKPLFNFFFAEDLPVYATSAIYTGIPMPAKDNDLNGIHFCDMPWVLQHSSTLQETQSSLEKSWPGSSQASRFFALGMDAYQIATQLGSAERFPSHGINGYTGDLYLNTHQRIQRGLTCAKFDQGVPKVD